MKNSETIVIKRSQIHLNPCNPKRHSDKQIEKQKANIKKVGFLGGIVWNKRTGNHSDGHRRVMALDIINTMEQIMTTTSRLRLATSATKRKSLSLPIWHWETPRLTMLL